MTQDPTIVRFLLDAAAAFPYEPTVPFSKSNQSTSSWSTDARTLKSIRYLSEAEQTKVLKFYRPSDAALSLASHLLKHLAVARCLSLPWSATTIAQERHISNGKPFFGPGGMEFNVSHHGALAVLAATTAPGLKVGVDVVNVNLEKDLRDIQRHGGWRAWSSVFEDAFSPAEMARIHTAVSEADDREIARRPADAEAALRVFYAHWALKEAYIKMTSEAFMATWLRELEFRQVRTPQPAGWADGQAGVWHEGECLRDIEVWLRGERVADVYIELQAVGASYMVATASSQSALVTELHDIDVAMDIAPLAEASSLADS